jgi:hypothetical protein
MKATQNQLNIGAEDLRLVGQLDEQAVADRRAIERAERARRDAETAAAQERDQLPLAGTHENPIRYERLDKRDPDYRAKMAAQLDKFTTDAQAGKVLCLSDLMCNAGM